MPPEPVTNPNSFVISTELYDFILKVAIGPILIFLIWLSWLILNRLMSPAWRQERRNREIRKAVAARKALRAEAAGQTALDETKPQENHDYPGRKAGV